MKLGELFYTLGFKADTMKLKEFVQAVGELNVSSIISAGSFNMMWNAASKLIESARDAGDNINRLTKETGESSDALQRWQQVAKGAGVSADTAVDSITKIRETIALMRKGIAPNQEWLRLGLGGMLQNEEDPDEIYKQLLGKIRSLESGDARTRLSNLGLSTENMAIAKQYPNIEEALSKVKVLSPEQLDKINENMKLTTEMANKINVLFATLGTDIIPGINTALDAMNSRLDKIGDSSMMKSISWFFGNLSKGVGANIGVVLDGWEKIFQSFDPEVLRKVGTGEMTMGPFFPGLDNPFKTQGATITQHNTITVKDSEDPNKTARAIDQHLGKHINDALNNGSSESY